MGRGGGASQHLHARQIVVLATFTVIPAKAGIHNLRTRRLARFREYGFRFHVNDGPGFP